MVAGGDTDRAQAVLVRGRGESVPLEQSKDMDDDDSLHDRVTSVVSVTSSVREPPSILVKKRSPLSVLILKAGLIFTMGGIVSTLFTTF